MKYFLLSLTCSLSLTAFAQYDPAQADYASELSNVITGEVISRHLHVLASDDLEGRETGTAGNQKAAQYIADQFKALGISPVPSINGYFQDVTFSTIALQDATLRINGIEYSHLRDFIIPAESIPGGEFSFSGDEVIFLGYGIDDPAYSDYDRRDVEGKAILIYKGEPIAEDGKSWITGTMEMSAWADDLERKLRVAKEHGAALVYIIEDQFRQIVRRERMFSLGGETVMGTPEIQESGLAPHVLLSSNIAGALLGKKSDKVIKTRDKIRDKGKPKSVKIRTETTAGAKRVVTSTPGANVLGFIEGTDPEMKDEVIVVTAHYDHLGKRGDDIFYGADDNGSGTSGVIAIAGAFAKAKSMDLGPRRSVLCMLVTGEEKGLLGSEYYSKFPVFPLENTVANVNIDMIGRVDEKHPHPNYTYVIGADRLSSELHEINESVNDRYTKLELDYTYNAESDPNRFYYRSDHYNFAKHGIPAIFYFSGVHEDYHRPTDTVDKIMFDKAALIAKLAFHTAWELANREERIKVDKS